MATEQSVRGDRPKLQYPDDRSDDLIQQLCHNLGWIEDLYRLSQQIAADPRSGVVFENILRHIVSGFSASSGTLSLMNESADALTIVAAVGFPDDVVGDIVPISNCLLAHVAAEHQAVLINGDMPAELRGPYCAPCQANPPPSAVCWPLHSDGEVAGVVCLSRDDKQLPFASMDKEHGQTLVNLISLALENARIHQNHRQQIDVLARMNVAMKAMNESLDQAHNQLLQSEKLASIGQLAAGVAHEINNPVGYVYSNLSTLCRYVADLFEVLDAYRAAETALEGDPMVVQGLRELRERKDLNFLREDLTSLVEESREGITRVKEIVQDLKDFAHVGETEREVVDLHEGLDSTLNIVWNELKYKAEVVKEYGDLPRVECVPSQINQVFMNLLVNAAQAIDGFGTITVRTAAAGCEHVWVEIADTGKGIEPSDLKRVFDPFFTTKPVGRGTGLGLSLSYNIVRQHGGTIDVRSEVGVGTSFRVTLPVRWTEDEDCITPTATDCAPVGEPS